MKEMKDWFDLLGLGCLKERKERLGLFFGWVVDFMGDLLWLLCFMEKKIGGFLSFEGLNRRKNRRKAN